MGLVPPNGIEPLPDDYKSTARPSCYGGIPEQLGIITRAIAPSLPLRKGKDKPAPFAFSDKLPQTVGRLSNNGEKFAKIGNIQNLFHVTVNA